MDNKDERWYYEMQAHEPALEDAIINTIQFKNYDRVNQWANLYSPKYLKRFQHLVLFSSAFY